MFNPQNLNRFSYVRNNPILYTDPSGHAICLDGIYCGTPTNSSYQNYVYPVSSSGNSGSSGNGNSGSSSGGIVSPLPQGPACTVNYCGQQNNLSVTTASNSINRFLQTAYEIEEYFNWSLTTPGEMTIYTTPGYPFLGGARAFYQPFFTGNNDSQVTIGPTGISAGSVSVGFNGTFRYKQGFNSITAIGFSPPVNLQPWALKVNMDTTLQNGDVSATHRIGVEYTARPDNSSLATAAIAAPVIGYGIYLRIVTGQLGQGCQIRLPNGTTILC